MRIIREHRKLKKRRQGKLSIDSVNSVVSRRKPSRCKRLSLWIKRFQFVEVDKKTENEEEQIANDLERIEG